MLRGGTRRMCVFVEENDDEAHDRFVSMIHADDKSFIFVCSTLESEGGRVGFGAVAVRL